MNEDTMRGSSEFLQYYQQTTTRPVVPPGGILSDANVVIGGGADNMLNPSTPTSSSQLTPKGCISKPIRRRSRASRRTPTTLLNADTTNFRALVQQFTGCSSGSASLGTQRGPINLTFGEARDENVVSVTSMVASFGINGYNHQTWPDQHHHHHHLQQHQQQQQQSHQEAHEQVYQEQQQSSFSSNNNIVSDVHLDDSYFFRGW